ncbi:TPA: DUF551 domain-containing protein [Klebsiella pneumoniae]|nr:DUF551 domain-containing protein [Klebsiella pneumoniae]
MTSKFSIENRELLQRISSGEAVVGIDFGNLIVRELAAFRLAAMDSSESVELPLDYLQGHKDGLEWAAQLAEANHPETGDWLYDDPIELAKAIRKGPDMPPAQPAPVVPGKWIPVSERMPENDGAYLCWDNRYVTTYAFIFGAWQANQFIAKNITHWMPLPAGPQEVSDA